MREKPCLKKRKKGRSSKNEQCIGSPRKWPRRLIPDEGDGLFVLIRGRSFSRRKVVLLVPRRDECAGMIPINHTDQLDIARSSNTQACFALTLTHDDAFTHTQVPDMYSLELYTATTIFCSSLRIAFGVEWI